MTTHHKTETWPAVLASALSFLAVLDWPYGYYQFLRIVVCVVAIYYIYLARSGKLRLPAQWIAFIVAVLFNPIIPIALARSTWAFFNIACGIYFIAVYKSIKRNTK